MPVPNKKEFCKAIVVCGLLLLGANGLYGQEKGGNITTMLPLVSDSIYIKEQIQVARKIYNAFPDSALDILQNALRKSRSSNFQYGIAYSLMGLGNTYSEMGTLREAADYYLQAIYYCQSRKSYTKLVPSLYNNIAIAYDLLGEYDKAAFYYNQALISKDRYTEARITKAEIYLNLSIVFAKLSQFDKAMSYMERAEQAQGDTTNYVFFCTLYNNKGTILYHQNKLEESRKLFEKSLRISNEHHLYNKEAEINIANIYHLQKQPEKAKKSLFNVLSGQEHLDPTNKVGALGLLGKIFLEQKDYHTALSYLTQFLAESQKLGLAEKELQAHLYLSEAYKALGKPWDALKQQEAYQALKDRVASKDVINTTYQLEAKYNAAQKDKELLQKQLLISNQQNDLKKKNFLILAIAIAALLLSFLFLLVFRFNKQKNAAYYKDRQQREKIKQLNDIMKGEEQERARIARELHDGIGGMLVSAKLNLGSIKEEYEKAPYLQKVEEVTIMLQNIASEVRRTVQNLMPDVLVRVGVEEALSIYCDEISAGSKMDISLEFQGDFKLSKSWELLLYRMVQELIQNGVKHAQASYMAVLLRNDGEQLSITVEDNGIGFDVGEHHNGFGLKNLEFRVAALRGDISIMSAKGRNTTIFITFPIEAVQELG